MMIARHLLRLGIIVFGGCVVGYFANAGDDTRIPTAFSLGADGGSASAGNGPQVRIVTGDGVSAAGTGADLIAAAQRRGRLEVIVRIAASETDPQARVAAVQNRVLAAVPHARNVYRFSSVPFVSLLATPAELRRLLADPNVTAISQNQLLRMAGSGASPRALALKDINGIIGANRLHNQGITGQDKVVILSDTGVNYDSAQLNGSMLKEACFSTRVAGQAQTFCPNGKSVDKGPGSGKPCPVADFPQCARGTEVAKVVTASPAGGKNVGVAPDSQLWVIQIFRKQLLSGDCFPDPAPCIRTNTGDLAKALDWTLDQAAAAGPPTPVAVAIGLSGGNFSSYCDTEGDPLAALFKKLKRKDITTAVSTGYNSLTNGIGYPSCLSDALAVGGTTGEDTPEPTSNWWPGPMVLAPGGGSEMAAPKQDTIAEVIYGVFAGAAALTDAPDADRQEAAHCTGQTVVDTTSQHNRVDARDQKRRAEKSKKKVSRKYKTKSDQKKVSVKRGRCRIKNERLSCNNPNDSHSILAEADLCSAIKYDITIKFRHTESETLINPPGGLFVGTTTRNRHLNGNFFAFNKGAGGLGEIRQLRGFDPETGAGTMQNLCQGPAPHDPTKFNTLRAVGNGRKLTLYLNGNEVCTTESAYFISGAVSFYAIKSFTAVGDRIEIESVTLKDAKDGPLPIEAEE